MALATDEGVGERLTGWIRPSEILAQLRGADLTKALSPSIRAQVVRKDDVGEVLVKIIQIFIVSFVGLLYLIAPRPADIGMLSSPTPFFLGAYLVLSLAGLVWALRPPVPAVAIYASIALDFILLYALIWSFHKQYGQPPSFVLKSPTLLYVFLFIAIRTLRFEVRFVVAAGAMAALGWIFILAWVIFADPEHAIITRNYVTYLTSNTVLLGAEIDKILLITMVTAVLALSLTLAKRLLVTSISETQAAGNLSRFFDPAVASDIRDQDADIVAPGDGDLRNATILFIDLRNFTTIAASRSPTAVIGALAAVQAVLVPIVRTHGGTIDKFMGDGIMVTFGAVRPSETHAADALTCAVAVLDGYADFAGQEDGSWFAAGGLGVAAAAGPVISGLVGVEGRLEFTVIGSAVNLCAKLEKHNKVIGSQGMTTLATLDLACRQGYAAERPLDAMTVDIPGIADAVEIVVLRRLAPAAALTSGGPA